MCGGEDGIYDPNFVNRVINEVLAKKGSGCSSDCGECFNDFCPERRQLRIDQIMKNNKGRHYEQN